MSSSGGLDAAELRVICGPTAAGKSAIALWLAEDHACTIISADSRQIYRGFDVGTAKPTLAERERVVHRGIDVIDPVARYSAARWRDEADTWVDQALRVGSTPLVVGGTGLYLRALFEGLFDEPPLDATRRGALASVLDAFSVAELRRWATALDPGRSHLGRTQLLRAVETALLAGHRVSDLHRAPSRPPQWRARYLLVDPGPALSGRLVTRVEEMFERGWVEEVRALVREVPDDAPAWKATGYRHVREYVIGRMGLDEARERIVIDTRQYAKRQRTWFRHQLAATAVTGLDPTTAGWRDVVRRWWTAGDGAGAEPHQ